MKKTSAEKPRFDARNPSTLAADAPEEDQILEIDEIGKGGQQAKRSAVNLDGYDTDSSNENFELRAAAKADQQRKENAPKDEEDNDMFADLEETVDNKKEDEELAPEGKKSKKDVRFLDVDDIEGQVLHSKSGGHVSAAMNGKRTTKDHESSSDSGDDEERARLDSDVDEEVGAGGKRKHAPRLDAFNMKAEDEEGKFDGDGNFVRKAAERDATHDRWLEGLSKKDMKKAREAQAKREEERRQRDKEDDSVLTSDILSTLIVNLERGETILEALQRLGKGLEKKKKVPNWRKNRRSNTNKEETNSSGNSVVAENSSTDAKRREKIEIITEAADRLLTRGQTEIYSQEREILVRQYERDTGDEWTEKNIKSEEGIEPTGVKRWQYRWSDKRDGGQLYGPYDGLTMSAWKEAGYFGEGVEFRRQGDIGWSRIVDFA